MPNNLSVLLFCASKSPDQKTLPAVEKEREELKDIFLKLQNGNRLKLIEEDEYSSRDLAKRIDIVNKHQVLLHIGGHANGEKVLGADGAIYVEGICESIRLRENELILAFINGCSSLEQAEKYFKIGGKVVIATTTAVEDFPAKDFALRFYECLIQRDSIERAFEKASALVKGKGYNYDSINDLIIKIEESESKKDQKVETNKDTNDSIENPESDIRGSRSKNNADDKKLPWRLVYQDKNEEYLSWKIPLVSERLTSWFPPARKIIGREAKIKELHSDLKNENWVVLHGLPGIGKSALAREYLKQYESEYKDIIWIDQDGAFKSSLADNLELRDNLKLNLTELRPEERYAAIVKKLDERGDPQFPSLLVVDNAEADLGDSNLVLPDPRKWKILATSRQSINEDIFKELDIVSLEPEKARELFLRNFRVEGEENIRLVDQILKHIDYHPLTIECSAKSLKKGHSNLEEFYNNLKNFKLDQEDSYFRSVYTGQETSILQHLLAIFSGRSFSEEERTLLIQLALMPSTDLPLRHLKVLLAGNAGFEKVLTKLDRLGWIAKDRNTSTLEIFYRLHRLIKDVIKYQFSKNEETKTYDIRLFWEPAKQVIQNLFDNLDEENSSNNFELLIYFFEINRVFGKDEVLDEKLSLLRSKWINAYASFLNPSDAFSKKEVAFIEHLQEVYPEEPIVYFGLGYYFFMQKKWDKAIDTYQKSIEFDPNFTIAYTYIGIALKDKGELDKAIGTYTQAIELGPKYAITYHNLGLALKEKGELDRAIDAFKEAIRLEPKDAMANLRLGIALKDKDELDQAIDAFKEAIRLDPNFAYAYLRLGDVLLINDNLDKAIDAYKKAILLDPNFAAAYLSLGLTLITKGDLNHDMQLDLKDPMFYFNLGIALYDKGDLNLAIHAYQKAIQLDPQDSETWNRLGWAELLQNYLAEATQSFLKAWELSDEKEYHAAMNLGHIELFSQNQPEAMIWYLKSVNLAKNKEEFFQGMEADYQDLKMEDRGISRERYTSILAQLRLSIGS